MTATMATANGALKEVYEGEVRDQLQSSAVSIKRIERSSAGVFETAGGKYVVFPVRKGRNQGISYRAENTQLAAAGRQGYQQAQETLKYGYGRVRLTGQVLELAKTNAQAFLNVMDAEMDGLKKDLVRDQNRIVWGNPAGFTATNGTGVITRCTAGAATSTVTAPAVNQIEAGMIIDIVDNTGTPVAGGTNLTVVSVAANGLTFVVSAAVTTVTGNNIVRAGNWNQEPYGFSALVSGTGTIHGINSATAGNEYWRSVEDSTTTTLTELAMVARMDEVRAKADMHPTAIFCSLGVRRSYFNLMTSLRRYNEPKEFVGGLVGLAFNYEKEIPVVTDIDCPSNSMYFIEEKTFTLYRSRDWYWADNDGSILKYVHDYDAWEALMKCYWQLVVHERNANARMTNLTEV